MSNKGDQQNPAFARSLLVPRSPTKDEKKPPETEGHCSLCNEPLGDKKRMRCDKCKNHFHKECITKNTPEGVSPSCPTCSKKPTSEPLHECFKCHEIYPRDEVSRREHNGTKFYVCRQCLEDAQGRLSLTSGSRKGSISGHQVESKSSPPSLEGGNGTASGGAEAVVTKTTLDEREILPDTHGRDGDIITNAYGQNHGGDHDNEKESRDKEPSSAKPNEFQTSLPHHSVGRGSLLSKPKPYPTTSLHDEDEIIFDSRSIATSRGTSKSKRMELTKKIDDLRREQFDMQKQMERNKKLIAEISELRLELESEASSVTEDDHDRTKKWVESPQYFHPPKNVKFNCSRQDDSTRQTAAATLRSKPNPIDPRSKFRHSTPMPWLDATTHDNFLNSLASKAIIREDEIAASTSRLTAEEMAARIGVPKELPPFSGNPLDWPMFINTYITSTRRCGFSDDENTRRLRKALSGEALKLVQAKLTFPEKINEAIAVLRLKYGRPDQILDSVLEKVERQPSVRLDDLEGLVDLAVVADDTYSLLIAAHLEDYLKDARLLRDLVKKLPPVYRLQWGQYRRQYECPDIGLFKEWMFSIAEVAAEMADDHKKKPHQKEDHRTVKEKPKRVFQTTVAVSEGVNCLICQNQSHSIAECPKFLAKPYNERWKTVSDLKLCGKCLKRHHYKYCKSTSTCGIAHCTRRHHKLLHKNVTDDVKPDKNDVSSKPKSLNWHNDQINDALFRIVPIILYGRHGESLKTYALLDEGSSVTLMESEIANSLNLDGPISSLCLKWTSDTYRDEEDSRIINLDISGTNGRRYHITGLRTVRSLNLPVQSILPKHAEVFSDYDIETYRNAKPTVLIGLSHWSLAVPLQIEENLEMRLTAVKSRLGWTIIGHNGGESTSAAINVHSCTCSENSEQLLRQLRDYFSIEYFGVRSSTPVQSKDDARAMTILQNTAKLSENQHFEVGLLWRYDNTELPESRSMALKRMECLERKLAKSPEMYEIVRGKIREYLEKGYAEILSNEEAEETDAITWYLPIFVVSNPSKPKKLRMVWDAAAKSHGISLNNMLLTGPDYLVPLVDILRRFRQFKFAVTGDLQEMFHQVVIRKEDRNAQRFLWRDTINEAPATFRMRVMTFGAACSPTSAQYIKNLNAQRFTKTFPEACEAITGSHYVDDYACSFKSIDQAVNITEQVISIHSQAGFNLMGITSNSHQVLNGLNKSPGETEHIDGTPSMISSTSNQPNRRIISVKKEMPNKTRSPQIHDADL